MTVTITGDALPTVAWQSTDFSDAGDTGPALAAVQLSPNSAFTVTINNITSNGTATAGNDYSATSGTLTFVLGETSKNIALTIADDATTEGPETVTLSTPTNSSLASFGVPTPS